MMNENKKQVNDNPPEMYIPSWELFPDSDHYPVKPISFLLKFAAKLPEVDESELIARGWAISKEELG